MKKDDLTPKDRGLRRALQRRNEASGRMTPSADFTDRLMQRITQPEKKPVRRRLWLYPATAVAAGVLLLVTLHFKYNKVETVEPLPPAVIALVEEVRDTIALVQDSCLARNDTSVLRESPVLAQQSPRKPSRKSLRKEPAQEPEISADSLARLTAAIEEELNQVADETYMRQMEVLINSDPQLRMIVNEIINPEGDDEQIAYNIKMI